MNLMKHIVEFKGELFICKAVLDNGVLVVAPKPEIDVLKLKEFKGTRSARDVNFLWREWCNTFMLGACR